MRAGFDRWDPDFDVNVGNLPYCILPKWGSRIHHGGQETVTKSADATGLEDAMNKYEWHGSLRRYLPGCDECVFRPRCTGIFRVYLQLHGEDEFRPVSRDALLALDPEQRNFVVLVAPRLAALRAALAVGEGAAGWRIEQEISEDRRRQVDIVFAHREGRARLVFVAPGRGRAPVITCDAYDVDVDVDPGVPTDAPGPPGLISNFSPMMRGDSLMPQFGFLPPNFCSTFIDHTTRPVFVSIHERSPFPPSE